MILTLLRVSADLEWILCSVLAKFLECSDYCLYADECGFCCTASAFGYKLITTS